MLSLALLCDSAPSADACQHRVFPMISKLEDPQLCPSHSEQTQIATPEYLGSADQSGTPHRGSSCLLEDAFTSIGMRQLLPQASASHSHRSFAYVQPSALPSSASYRPHCGGAASVFVPCHEPQPLQVHCHYLCTLNATLSALRISDPSASAVGHLTCQATSYRS